MALTENPQFQIRWSRIQKRVLFVEPHGNCIAPGAEEFSWCCLYRRRIVNTLPHTWIMNLRTITDVVWFVVPVLLVIIASCLSLW